MHIDSALETGSSGGVERIRRVQVLTIAWMLAEAAVSLFSAWRAHSSALLAFGGDSAVELVSAVVVLWTFRATAPHHDQERWGTRVAGALLFVLAFCVAVTSVLTLSGHSEPQSSITGMVILLLSAVVMPWLAKEKRRLSADMASAALRADAAQSAICAYLSLIAFLGVGVNTVWHIRWADPLAALLILPLVVWEGWESLRSKACGCR
jgi:divalent metal cation (Fe/Co/Zn/Cd) transporter